MQLLDEVRAARQRIAARKASEVRRQQAIKALQNERQLLRELLDLQHRELKLVAYEIHDGLAQQLAGALLRFQVYSRQQRQDPGKARRTFHAAMRLLDNAMNEARRLIRGLGPAILDESGIVPALDCLVCAAKEVEGPEIEFVHSLQFERLSPPLEIAVFRIVQEALTNACRHSRSKRVRLKLAGEKGHVRVEVRDWGIGFDPEQVKEDRFGLQGIRERARLLGGRVTIETAPAKGTRIAVELPLRGKMPQ